MPELPLHRLQWLHRLTDAVSRASDLESIFECALDALLGSTEADRASILLFDEAGAMRFVAWRGLSETYRAAVDGHSPWAADAVDPEPIFIEDMEQDPTLEAYRPVFRAEGIRGLGFVPLLQSGRLIGKFMLYYAQPHAFSEGERLLSQIIAGQAAFAVERRRAEAGLRTAREELEAILRGVADGISAMDAKGTLLYVNDAAARLLGFASRELLLKSTGPEVAQRFEMLDEKGGPLPLAETPTRIALSQGREATNTIRFRIKATKEERWSRVSSTPVLGEGGRVRFAVNVFRDITAEREADRRKDEFLAILGHELRNPLAPIALALQLMDRRGDAAFAQERRIIRRQVDHVMRLVDDLLDVSRITRGRLELKRRLVRIGEVLDHAIELASPLLEERKHRLETEIADRGLELDADPTRLAQVLTNLLTNAAKYTEPGGRITLRTTSEAGFVLMQVEDSGMGIEPELLPRIFDLFTQSSQALDRSRGGLGLGLPIVRHLVRMHGGEVEVTSAGPGQGSTFTLRLPRGSLLQPPAEPASTLSATPASRGGLRVLVVDDNQDAADMLAAWLRTGGHEVEVALDGPSALARAQAVHPEVAILDIGLPGMDGYALATALRAQEGPALRGLAALTGYGLDRDRQRSQECGFDLHLVKPADLEQLSAFLGSLRAGRSRG